MLKYLFPITGVEFTSHSTLWLVHTAGYETKMTNPIPDALAGWTGVRGRDRGTGRAIYVRTVDSSDPGLGLAISVSRTAVTLNHSCCRIRAKVPSYIHFLGPWQRCAPEPSTCNTSR